MASRQKDPGIANRSVAAPVSGKLPLANFTPGIVNTTLQSDGSVASWTATPRTDTAYYEGRIVPTSIAANTNDYNPIDSGTSQSFHVVAHISVASTGAFNITGFDVGATGEFHVFTNRGTNTITLKHNDSNSSVNNRLWCPNATDYAVQQKTSVYIYYSQPDNKWLVVATPAGSAGSNALLDGSVHSDTVAQTVTRGALVYGNSTPKWDKLAVGASNTVLSSDGTDVSWQTLSSIGANVKVAQVSLTDTQIKSLNSSPFSIISAPGSGKQIIVLGGIMYKDTTAGAYNVTGTMQVRYAGTTIDHLNPLSGMQLNVAAKRYYILLQQALSASSATDLNLAINLVTTSDFTGGNAANKVNVVIWYAVADIQF